MWSTRPRTGPTLATCFRRVRAYLPEDHRARWALAATVPVASCVLVYKEYHRLDAMGEACWAHLAATYRTRGLSAWYKARHTGPCVPPPPPPPSEPSPPEPTPVETEWDGGQHGDSGEDLLDWLTPISPSLQYWARRMVASVSKRFPDLAAQAGQRLAHLQPLLAPAAPFLCLLAAGALVFWAMQLLTVVVLGLTAL